MNHPCVDCNCFNSVLYENGEVECLLSPDFPSAVLRICGGSQCEGYTDTAEIMGEPVERYQVFHVHVDGERRPFTNTQPEPKVDAERRANEYSRLWADLSNTQSEWTIQALPV